MKRQSQPIISPITGLDLSKDPALIVDTSSIDMDNVRFHKGVIKKEKGLSSFGSINERPMSFVDYIQYDGTKYQICISVDRAYQYSGGSWSAISQSEELVSNGGFDSDTTGWTLGNAATLASVASGQSGNCLEITCDGTNDPYAHQTISSLVAGETYTLSWYVKAGTEATWTVDVYDLDNTTYIYESTPAEATGSWVQFSHSITLPAGCTSIRIDLSQIATAGAATTLLFDTVSLTTTTVFTGDADDRVVSTIFNDVLYISNGVDDAQKYDGSTWETMPGLDAITVTGIKCIATFYSHVFIANISESGNRLSLRVRWSDTGDGEDWNTGKAGALDLQDTPGEIVELKVIKDRLFAFKTDAIYELVYVGEDRIVDPRLVINIGTEAPDTIVPYGNVAGLLFTDGICEFDGLYRNEIGKELYPIIFETEERTIRQSKINRSRATYVEETQQYVLALPDNSDDCNVVYRINVNDKGWSKQTMDVTCFGQNIKAAKLTWSDAKALGTKWNNSFWDVPWKKKSIPEGSYSMLVGQSDFNIKEDDRTSLNTDELSFTTKDFILARAARFEYVQIRAKGDSFTVRWSLDQGITWSQIYTVTPNSSIWTECRQNMGVTGITVRFWIKSNNSNINIKWIEPFFISRARSFSVTQ